MGMSQSCKHPGLEEITWPRAQTGLRVKRIHKTNKYSSKRVGLSLEKHTSSLSIGLARELQLYRQAVGF